MDCQLLCCYCDKKFNNFEELEAHLRSSKHRINSKTKFFPCKTNNCGLTYTNFKDFKSHVVSVHNLAKFADTVESNNSWVPSNISFDNIVLKSIANLRLNNVITGTALGTFVNETENILRGAMSNVQTKIKEYFGYKQFDSPDANEFVNQFTFNDSYSKYTSMRGQIQELQKKFNYVNAESKYIGPDNDEYMYVPFIKTLQLILSNEEVMQYIENHSNKSDDDLMRSYEDGDNFKNHPFFKKYPNALRIVLYFDEFLGNNPLSNKARDQKIGAFYFSILNLPPHLNNFIGNVHVLALCHEKFVQKYSLNEILEPFINELKLLERDEGVPVFINNKEYALRGTLVAVTADTAAANPLLGQLGPGATHFCRLCMISRNELHKRCYFCAEKRTKDLLEEQLQEIKNNPSASTETGVKGPCILNELKYYNTCCNKVFDVLHDLFEGWIPYVIKLFAAYLVLEKKCIDVDTLNYRLKIFLYGGPENSNKPSPSFDLPGLKKVNSEHKLQQKGVQTWCLLRVFPFIIFDKIEPDDIYLEYLLNLNKIVEIIMAPKISRLTLPYLRALLETHYNQFNILFPSANKINKIDHIMHIPDCIKDFGPMCNYACFKYEDKHQLFQKYAKICNNFTNISKSMINQSQIYQCSLWGSNKSPIREKITYSSINKIKIEDLFISELFIKSGFKMDDEVGQCDKVYFYSIKYKIELFVAIELHEKTLMPTFGEIKNIFIIKDEVFLYCNIWNSNYLKENLNAYKVEQTVKNRLINVKDLCDPKPFALWNTFTNDTFQYVSLRYILY